MDIKAILLDFDGTTLQRDQVFISVRNMYAIRKALDKGIYIVPSTGRAENMQPPQIEAEKRIRYYITSGGARVVDHSTGEIIHEEILTPEDSGGDVQGIRGQEYIYGDSCGREDIPGKGRGRPSGTISGPFPPCLVH